MFFKRNKYEKYIPKYGALTMLCLIRHFESRELYEEAALVKKALDDCKHIDDKFRKRLCEDHFEDVRKSLPSYSVQDVKRVYATYAYEILSELNLVQE